MEVSKGMSLQGGIYREVSTGKFLQGGLYREFSKGRCLQGGLYREVSKKRSPQGGLAVHHFPAINFLGYTKEFFIASLKISLSILFSF